LKLVVIWANPDATCPTICFDGFAALVNLQVFPGKYKAADTPLNVGFTAPTVKATWQ
jgi:hypothetical protein